MRQIPERARRDGVACISLSVDPDDPAKCLSERLGYVGYPPNDGVREDDPRPGVRCAVVEPLVAPPRAGRIFRTESRVRLSDMDATGRLRLDAVARCLQDAATDDVEETGWGSPEHLWVLRSIRIDVLAPCLDDRRVAIATWGSGFSALAAARRWSLEGDRGGRIEVDSVWIHLGPDARPARIGEGFDAYKQAAVGRSASTALTLPHPPADSPRIVWPLRVTDVDVLGHMNNAAYWQAVEQCLADGGVVDLRLPLRARLDYRHPIDLGEAVELVQVRENGRFHVAFVSGDVVKAVASAQSI
jgi:acyl-ACP thioesterase